VLGKEHPNIAALYNVITRLKRLVDSK